jgi:hypothetical protein
VAVPPAEAFRLGPPPVGPPRNHQASRAKDSARVGPLCAYFVRVGNNEIELPLEI